MGNERPCDLCVLFDSTILAHTLLKVEFFIRLVYSPKHNSTCYNSEKLDSDTNSESTSTSSTNNDSNSEIA